MDTPTPAPTLRLDLRGTAFDDALLEEPMPELHEDPELRAAVEAERYDEQILAALVSP